jgi:alpha-L-arabinofuranosidase
MATYAPLFAHVEGWQWRPDMIWFDNLRSVKTCSYYVQQLYSHNKGTNVLPLTMAGQPVSGQECQDGLFASAVWDKDANTYIVKVINVGDKAQPITLNFTGLKKNTTLTNGKVITFHTGDLLKDNTVDAPNTIIPVESGIAIDGNVLNTQIGPKTFCVYKFVKNGK